ncbi:heat-labile enterotoxin alpha chain domain-containing protein [Hirsutella rhossiliensis]|uniref:Heat-labile enterotoxin alpha chain domain-containing protein n=1 Tax=Hirsutella rhossiliensis TaxID=111463 RepID=A0A9P8MUE8_9HYPO|nr:heat-labile enterotoxin alpha chain domain-containing protein [Hirsutella rhossiliensis]KAH0959397.1 heat-labile enterotoxin alpha chain domain-containing protein [Hirsutella rhossiliensis]
MATSLGDRSLSPEEAEVAAVGGIRLQQIRGWLKPNHDVPDDAELEQVVDSSFFEKNPEYDEAFDQFAATLNQPQLAGFEDDEAVWGTEEWKALKPPQGQSAQDNVKAFMDKNGAAVGWEGNFPSSFPVKDSESPGGEPGDETPKNEPCKRDGLLCVGKSGPNTDKEPNKSRPGSSNDDGIAKSEPERVLPPAEEEIPKILPEPPAEVLHPNFIRVASYLQAAQMLTSVAHSAIDHINNSSLGSDIEHHNWAAVLKDSGSILHQVSTDNVPGLHDIEKDVAKMKSDLQSIDMDRPLEAVTKIHSILSEHTANVELIIVENYVPGLPEIRSNFNGTWDEVKHVLEKDESSVLKAEEIALSISKRTLSTINDVLRGWFPFYKESQDTTREHINKVHEDFVKYKNNKESLGTLIKDGITWPVTHFRDALHKVAQNYIPWFKPVEDKLHLRGRSQPRNTLPPNVGDDKNEKGEQEPFKFQQQEWNKYIRQRNASDWSKTDECIGAKAQARQGDVAKVGTWQTQTNELTRACYAEQFNEWKAAKDPFQVHQDEWESFISSGLDLGNSTTCVEDKAQNWKGDAAKEEEWNKHMSALLRECYTEQFKDWTKGRRPLATMVRRYRYNL